MNFAENKYKTLIRSGRERAPNKDQKDLLRLRVQHLDINKKSDTKCNAKMVWKK